MSTVLEKGSLVLVTGANGFLGSHIVDQFLSEGYKVRGTVRSSEKNAWLQEYFDKKYGSGLLELAQVEDFTKEGCFDDAVKGVKAFVHVASDLSFKPDPNLIVTPAIKSTQHALSAAAEEPGIRAFVLTSSSTAATAPKPNTKFHISRDLWNEDDISKAWAPPPYEPERAWAVYGASKAQSEQAAWEFMKEKKPHFILNTVLPNANFGNILDSKHQDGSTAAWIKAIFGPSWEKIQKVPAQYYVHPSDTAKLHVAAATDSSVKNERIFAFAEPYNWNQVLDLCRKLRPQATVPENIDNDDKDLSTVDNELAKKILKDRFGQDGFLPLEKGIKDNLDSFM
ncbi:NAD(P)-binding protein [Cystobasidium minutum MCA 4210]|uniref:NAD(P)-binding protein n=1 Tax=Cystobasidium minutum MCA 4210 TaxID=1397322 RepID=UPI0034CF879F|eukprot:jgi/Rhomi1/74345/CE74344_2039